MVKLRYPNGRTLVTTSQIHYIISNVKSRLYKLELIKAKSIT
jgi:hypothetical protein